MTDNLTSSQRSKCMSKIKSKWTKEEKVFHDHLKWHQITHLMHPKMQGNPDILLKEYKSSDEETQESLMGIVQIVREYVMMRQITTNDDSLESIKTILESRLNP